MAVVYEEALQKEIISGKLSKVYILFGDDAFLKKHYYNKLSEKSYGGDPFFNFQKFEGDIDLQNVYDAVKQFPMMANSKCVTVSDFDFEHASKEDFDRLCSLISEVEEGCVLILRFDAVEFDYKKSAKAKKIISEAEAVGGKAVLLDHRKPAGLVKMLVDGAKKRGCKISDSTARYMIEIVGEDINTLQNELNKLCFFVKGGEIDKATLERVVVKSVEASVFDYVKEILNANIQKAMEHLNNMFYLQIEPMVILYTVSSSYVDMYRVYAAGKVGINNSQISSDFVYKNKSFLLDHAKTNLKKLDRKKIQLSFEALLWADKALKSTGAQSAVIMEQLTVKLVYIIVEGEALD